MNSPQFEAVTRVTRKSCGALARARLGRHLREMRLITALLAAGTLLLAVLGSNKALWLGIPLILVGGYTLLVVPLTAARQYGSRNTAVVSTRISFAGDGMRVLSRVEESRIGYDQVLELMQYEEYLMIRLRQHTPLVFERAEVEGGRSAGLMEYLEAQTGRKFRCVRL